MTPAADPETLAKLERMLNDPIAGPKLMAILNQPNTGVAGNLANIASQVGKQQTPSGQLGAGIGGLAAMGIGALRRRGAANPTGGGPGGPNIPGAESVERAQAGPPDDDPLNDMTPLDGYAEGGVLKRRKKRAGGKIKARRPAAIPPRHGETPAPFAKGGHVQAPRGSGCAERGKQFRGIY